MSSKPRTNLGDFMQLGKYVGYICLTYEVLIISQVCNLIYMIFGGLVVDVIGCGDQMFTNATTGKEKCSALERARNDTPGCQPKYQAVFHSVNYEFEYLCGAGQTVKNSTSFQMLGLMLGAMAFGQISDTFGRRKALIFGTIGLIISGMLSTFATGIYSFTIARIFVMFFTGGKHSCSYVFMMENLPSKHRMWIVTVITYSPNYLVFTGIAYLTGDWRILSRVMSAFTIIPLIMLIFVYESPRWLVQKGRIDEARDAILGMGNWDHSNTPEKKLELDAILDKERQRIREASENKQPQRRYYTYHLFSTRSLAIYTSLFAYSLMITNIISYGLAFNMEKLSGSPYLNTIFLGSLRYAINVCVAIIDIKFVWAGRRLLHGFSMSSIAVCLGCAFTMVLFNVQWQTGVRITALTASAMCSQIFILNAVAPSELFPTAIRNIGIGFIQTFNRIGGIIAPQIFFIGKLWTPLPYLVMFGMSLFEVIAYESFVPETKGKPLPDRMPGEDKGDTENGIAGNALEKQNEESVPLNEDKK